MRLSALRLVTLLGAALWAITESLGGIGRLQRGPLIIAWLLVAGCGAIALAAGPRRRVRMPSIRPDPVIVISIAASAVIVVLTGFTAVVSPPNSTDAMAYHMPRVIYWAEQSSVRFFPTPYLNQIMLQPFAEYAALHSYLLSGGDRFINAVQWCASLVSMIAVSVAAGFFGATPRGQALAALFCATLPSGILASTGAKNDYVLAMWLVIAVCFTMRFAARPAVTNAIFLGLAMGLALSTKATAYLYLPWLIAAVLIARWRPRSRQAAGAAAVAVACALIINTPHYIRNFSLSGSIMGFDSAQADGFFRWRNETLGWKQALSNIVRNVSEQLAGRSERWNQSVYNSVLSIHRRLGIDPNDPATTWRWTEFAPPKNSNHEANAPSRLHLMMLLAIACVLGWRFWQRRDVDRALYMAALVCAFVSFCAYLKWQPFLARLFLPLLVAASPMAAIFGEIRPAALALFAQIALCVVLPDTARRPLLQNWIRPLQGAASVLRVPRSDQYFADMTAWNNGESYRQSADLIAAGRCGTVGIDINNLQIEYPLIALIREHSPSTQFIHTAVANASRRYRQPVESLPCVIACLDCAGDTKRLSLYTDFPKTTVFGRFVILSRE